MNHTLSQIKPRERTLLHGENKNLLHTIKNALIDNDPETALLAQTQIQQAKRELEETYKNKERQRQYQETLKLSEAYNLQLAQTIENLDDEEEQLEQKHEQELEELKLVHETNLKRLQYQLQLQKMPNVTSPEYIGLKKEFEKLMKLKRFDDAVKVKKLMNKMQASKMKQIQQQFEEKADFQIYQLMQQQNNEKFNVQQRQQRESKDMKKRHQLKLFETVQNYKNSKMEMSAAHSREFINFKKNNVDRDIVKHRRTQDGNSTFRGTQKLEKVISSYQ